MNKKLIYVLILSIAVFLTGCSLKKDDNSASNVDKKNTNETSENTTEKEEKTEITSNYKISDYLNVAENLRYDYAGENSEYAEFVAYVDYISGDKFQIRTNNGGTETVTVFQNKDGELKEIFKRNEGYYRENFTSKAPSVNEIILKEPLVKGTTWTLTDGSKRYISNIDVKISTPSGDYSALEVTTEHKEGTKDLYYFALDKGFVMSTIDAVNFKVSSSLKSISKDSKFNQTVRFYYPDADYNIHYEEKQLSFATNDITKMTIQNMLKSFTEQGKANLMGKNVTINSLYLNDDNMVYVDFTKNFVTEMNAGSGYEGAILQSIVNTLGNYYGTNKVYITLDNEPYSSGHIVKGKGEYFEVTPE